MKEMKIVSFTYCEDVQNDSQGRAIIVAPMQLMITKYLPTSYSFNVSFGIFNVPKEGVSVETEFIDSNGKMISSNFLQIPSLPVDKIAFSDLPFGLQVNVNFRNIDLEISGEYKTIIKLNGNKCGEYPIEVCHAKQF